VGQIATKRDDIDPELETTLTQGRELLLRHEQRALQVAFLSEMTVI